MTKTKLDMITKLKDISQDITRSERKLKVSLWKENAVPKSSQTHMKNECHKPFHKHLV